MTVAQFEEIALTLGIAALVGVMFFIVYDLARKSRAGRLGTLILFLALGLGVAGFLAKTLFQYFLQL
ncbi:MAG: DUF2788 domain-containing protein [Desulfobacterales bacterium]|nr:DUF2788 domain-containing protein [Desulfobacterales bacterium]